MDRKASRLDISINSQFLKTLPLAGSWWSDWFGTSGAKSFDGTASLTLPRYNLFGQNDLVFDYNLILADKQKCTAPARQRARGGRSGPTIDLSHAYHALEMPDLATFAGAGYPFTIRPDLGETTVLMSRNPTPASVEAFLNLMGRFDSTGIAATGVTVAEGIDPDRLSSQDILVIGSSAIAGAGQVFANAPLHWDGHGLKVAQKSPLQYVTALFSDRGSPTRPMSSR
jgi:cellulose synthase (UDP-forming)